MSPPVSPNKQGTLSGNQRMICKKIKRQAVFVQIISVIAGPEALKCLAQLDVMRPKRKFCKNKIK